MLKYALVVANKSIRKPTRYRFCKNMQVSINLLITAELRLQYVQQQMTLVFISLKKTSHNKMSDT